VFKHDIGDERRLDTTERFGEIDEVERLDTREEAGEVRMRDFVIAVFDTEVILVVRDKCKTNI
jgi:hypothetical protein